MKATKKNVITLMLVILLIISLSILVLQGTGAWNIYASADAGIVEEDNSFVVISDPDNIAAEFDFYQLNDMECSVTLRNMDATKAIIPSVGIINGKEYSVTEISGSGFSSAEKLIRVYIPESVKKIGSRAFYGCTSLELIYLYNVEEIEGSAFGNCTSLSQLIIPETVTYVGSNILRNNNTRVRVRGAENANWSSSWNNRNSSEYEVEYNSTVSDPNILETIYNTNVRSATPVIEGYSVASGQPKTKYHLVNEEDGNIIIPATYKDEGNDTVYKILAIDSGAFDGVVFNNLIVEYSTETIYIGEDAFAYAEGAKVIINRPVEFKNWYDLSQNSNQQFASSSLETIVLPSSVPCLTNSMFESCINLENLYFIEISDKSSSVLLGEIEERIEEDKANKDTGKVYLSQNENFTSIGNSAFQNTPNIIELHIYYSNIKTVGYNIVNQWNSKNQEVSVHNETKIQFKNGIDGEGWHAQWFGNFTNYSYDNEIYTITFAPNGGELDVPDKKDVVYEESVGELPIPHNGIWIFDGWYTDDNEKYSEDTVYMRKGDITLTAHWIERYQITLMHNNGTNEYDTVYAIIDELMPEIDIYGNRLTKPSCDGYVFQGYTLNSEQYYDKDLTAISSLDIKDNLTLYAYWEREYHINYVIEDLKGVPENFENPNPITFSASDLPLYIKPVECNGYIINWDLSYIPKNTAENLEVKGAVSAKEYTITYDLDGGNSNGGNPETYTVEDKIILKDATHPNLYFNGWTIDGNKITTISGLYGNITLKATWSEFKTIHITSAFSTLKITDTKVSLIFDVAFSSSCTINVSANTALLAINGRGYVYRMNINILNRNTSFGLLLFNMGIVAHSSESAIKMSGSQTLNLFTSQTVIIKGCTSNYSGNGVAAISCPNLIIQSADNLYIQGGDGANGANNANGAAGNGGNAGHGVLVSGDIIINCSNVTVAGGIAGKGGNGIYKGYGGLGAAPFAGSSTSVLYVLKTATNLYFLRSSNGADGTGADINFVPITNPGLVIDNSHIQEGFITITPNPGDLIIIPRPPFIPPIES